MLLSEAKYMELIKKITVYEIRKIVPISVLLLHFKMNIYISSKVMEGSYNNSNNNKKIMDIIWRIITAIAV